MRAISLLKSYFNDLKNSDDTKVKIIKVGKPLKILYVFISFPLISLLTCAIIVSYNRGDFSDVGSIYGLIEIITAYIIIHLILYIGLLASHIIVTNDYVEYVQYFIKRRKIKLCDIKDCQTVYLSGVAKTLRIISKDKITYIDINYSFFNSLEDLKNFATSIGFPNAIKYKEKRVLTEEEKKKRKQQRKRTAKKVLNVIISILLIACFEPIIFFTLSYYFKINSKITKIMLYLPLIIGWKISPAFWGKTKKYSLMKMIFLTILSIIVYCLVFFVSGSLYSYLKFGHI